MGLPVNNVTTVHYQYIVKMGDKSVGTIQRFNPTSERTLQRIREIMGDVHGDTVEIAKGRTDSQITVERFEVNKESLMDILAPGEELVDIGQITKPITIVEIMTGTNIPGGRRVIEYQDCEPKSWSKTISVDTVVVSESVTFWVTRIVKGA